MVCSFNGICYKILTEFNSTDLFIKSCLFWNKDFYRTKPENMDVYRPFC